MIRRTANMTHAVVAKPVSKLAGYVAGSIIGEQSRFLLNLGLVATGCLQGKVQGLGHVVAGHAGAQLPGNNLAGEVVQYRRQVHPAPANDLQVGKIRLPLLIDGGGLVLKLAGGLSTGPRTEAGKAKIGKAQWRHGKYVNWRARREKEKSYFRQIRMVMAQAREAGLIED